MPSHELSQPGTPHQDRWDNINPPESSEFAVTSRAPALVSADQLRHPLAGKALSMIKKAEHLISIKDYIHAREELKKALKDSNAAPYAHSLLGQEFVRSMAFPDAIGELSQAVQMLPSSVADHANLGYALMMTGQPAPAEKELRRALELQPANPRTHLVLGVLCYAQGGRDQEAEEHLEFAARNIPSANLMLEKFYKLTGRREANPNISTGYSNRQ